MDDNSIDNFFEKRLVGELNKPRIDDTFTDFAICINEDLIKVHKIVLAANSDYFKAMLTSDSSEEIKNGRVTLEDIDPEIVKLIVNYWYTGTMEVTSENICPLLLATSRFQANDALEMCTKFAEANLTAANCLSIAFICERCNLVKLFRKAFALCLNDFEDIIKDTGILSIEEELLMKIISDDRLNVSDEMHVFVLIIRWIEFDKETRSSSLDKLMGQVRYASIRPASLFEPSFTKFINCSAKYRELCERAKTILLLRDNPSLQRNYAGSFLSKPRNSESRRLYVIGGCDCSTDSVMNEVYDPIADQWSELGKAPLSIGPNLAVVISKNCVCAMTAGAPYVVVIRDPDPPLGASLYYNLDTNHWSPGAGLTDKDICTEFLVALDGCVYSFGASTHYIDTVNRYDLSKKTLKSCAKMQMPRMFPGIFVHDHYIYVMGGIEPNSSPKTTRSVERYDPRHDKWEFVASMTEDRTDFSGCSYKGKIYVAGGSEGATNLAEVYDPKLDTWTEIRPMNCSRTGFGLAEISGQIYALGGLDRKTKPTNSVEAYDPDSDTWIMKKEMRNKRFAHCVLVL